MKNLYLIGGTMGAGKTTVCRILKQRSDRCVFLDGDWCWDMALPILTPETRKMVMENIIFLLNNFLRCPAYENILFCWVMHEQKIIDDILAGLDTSGCRVRSISLVLSEKALRERLQRDVAAGIRTGDIISRSLERLPMYDRLDTEKIDVSDLSPEQTAERIMKYGQNGGIGQEKEQKI